MTTVPTEFDRLKQSLKGFVKTVMNRVDYLAMYPGAVVKQNGDGTVQVQPDDMRLPVMDNVHVKHGMPGLTVQVGGGARILIGFSNGRPDQPYAALWDPVGTVLSLTLSAQQVNITGSAGVTFNSGLTPVAKEGSTAGPYPIAPGTGSPFIKVP